MTSAGWLILSLSVGSVTVLFAWCLAKVLGTPGEAEHVHGFEQDLTRAPGDGEGKV